MANRKILFITLVALFFAVFIRAAGAQNPALQQKVVELKQASAQNKQMLAQYTWQEQVTISLKGEQKKQEHFQVRLGPDGKPQKQSLDPPQQQPQSDSGGRRGRLKEHVVEKKTEEYQDYANQIKALIQQYVPPEQALIQQAQQSGNIALTPSPGQYTLTIRNYIKQGDNMSLVLDAAQKDLVSVSINTFLNDPKDAVTVSVQFARTPGGPNHVSMETINGVSKQLTIAINNSNYQHL